MSSCNIKFSNEKKKKLNGLYEIKGFLNNKPVYNNRDKLFIYHVEEGFKGRWVISDTIGKYTGAINFCPFICQKNVENLVFKKSFLIDKL